ncbi:hypothetical protein GCM10023340_35030 [Nocardioides marinquilinus]|uniref:Uncharacterized protein n=1 Tax=Nocardioides marinquilinus TaxID=1210400 RepID=A0ABP9PYR0_9ACTN
MGVDGVPAPVELAIHQHTSLGPWPGTLVRRAEVGPRERTTVAGVPVATPARALLDEIRTRGRLWPAVQAIDMTAAARLLSVWLFAEFLWWCHARTGVGLARHAASLAVDESRSPRESWLRLVWQLVAGLPDPLVNAPVYDLGGRLIGVPDLFDPAAGLVGEYAGAIHRSRSRHRRDRVREERFRDHGLEYAEIVAGDSRSAAAGRLLGARKRAPFLSPERRAWTLDRPAWDPAPETLDDYFDRTGQAAAIRACEGAPLSGADTWIPGRPPEGR